MNLTMKNWGNRRLIPIIALSAVGCVTLFSQMSVNPAGMVAVLAGEIPTPEGMKHIKPFLIDKDLVTVKEFDEFVNATGYTTEADRFGNAGVFIPGRGWEMVEGANYLFPFGKGGDAAPMDHPVTQVSWNDANAYAKWKNKRLPTQWEWELAAQNNDSQYTWGDKLIVNGSYKANTWQGSFPYYNTVDDGYAFTSPVGAFGENAKGLTDMGGNVWQWCQDEIDPTPQEARLDPGKRRVLRGGSFLCDPQVCHGFRVQGKASSTAESAMAHIGFRCAKDFK